MHCEGRSLLMVDLGSFDVYVRGKRSFHALLRVSAVPGRAVKARADNMPSPRGDKFI